jgi:hypothetical protein
LEEHLEFVRAHLDVVIKVTLAIYRSVFLALNELHSSNCPGTYPSLDGSYLVK